ncbi:MULTISPECIES: hypothetical protein [Photorhabdus]|uniref:Uncharacterized protein n=2 Tax=Photorhabdus TaxID=29487 RepID=A0ABX0AWI3_9GAMM|nr:MULTISPECIES: hypothetical protein [Photorhabdus]MCC8375495.1 hypothetical protein [Photorhabdus bodei]MCC8465620.1 hypothetical protein [Photorhabdus bodei]MCT8354635.1 hypothetical protein [Photorhabdus kayaii]MDB6375258.1 hypothetical protein [Photorhabdus bodei]NDL10235.1 hypothetical protein [Photorhabdus kayaii]
MLNNFSRYALTASSVAPVCITLAFLAFINKNWLIFSLSISIAVISVLFCYFIIIQAIKYNPITIKNLESASPADKEITNYFLTYLFPLISGPTTFMNIKLAIFFYISLFFYIKHSSSYSFNPIVSVLFKYRFYEAEDDTGVSFVLMTKKPLLKAKIKGARVKKLTEHTYILCD